MQKGSMVNVQVETYHPKARHYLSTRILLMGTDIPDLLEIIHWELLISLAHLRPDTKIGYLDIFPFDYSRVWLGFHQPWHRLYRSQKRRVDKHDVRKSGATYRSGPTWSTPPSIRACNVSSLINDVYTIYLLYSYLITTFNVNGKAGSVTTTSSPSLTKSTINFSKFPFVRSCNWGGAW